MTHDGGTSGIGNVFSVKTNGTGFNNLLSFSGTNGEWPFGDVTLSGSTLYGMTLYGGADAIGNIFSINADGTGFSNLITFDGTNGADFPSAL